MGATTTPTVAGLEPSAAASLSFTGALEVRTFRLRRPAGDLLVYHAGGADGSGIHSQYLGHWHEAAEGGPATGADVYVHAADAGETRSRLHLRGTFDRPFALDDDFEAIPMPGHTPGSTAYRWTAPDGRRVLFTADSVTVRADGSLRAAVLDTSDPAAYAASLERLAQLDVDVLAPWAAVAGADPIVLTTPAEARERLSALAREVLA